jgi:hypothetical protein
MRRIEGRLALACGILVGLLGLLQPPDAEAQLEVLLRGVEAQTPLEGSCARYQFTSDEPDGSSSTTFIACVESVPDEGPVVLQLSSGDSLQVRIAVRRRLFEGPGAELADNILRVERTRKGEVQILTPEDWRRHPALAPAAPLPVVADSSLGQRKVTLADGARITAVGHYRREKLEEEHSWSGVQVTTSEDRQLRLWTMPQAPILGVVLAEASVRSERIFSEPIPGVPERGPRIMTYRLELLEILQTTRP